MTTPIVYDLETYPNCFLAGFVDTSGIHAVFEISDRMNQSQELYGYLMSLKDTGCVLVGFNNIGFDYPILHMFLKMRQADAKTLYDKAMSIIQGQDEDRWSHQIYANQRVIEQIDLFKIHHFDNRSKSTSLKALEFNMRMDNIQELPFPVGIDLNHEQKDELKKYLYNDLDATMRFMHETQPMIDFRRELSTKYNRDFMNHNDTKIGKDYFAMRLEQAGVALYDYGSGGRQPRQTKRPQIYLNQAILPWIQFDHPEFNRVLNWLKGQVITETKGVFKDLSANVNGFEFVFGLGGIHGSVDSEVVESDSDYVIVDLDVASYYPNLSIANQFYPAHLGETFCHIYKDVYEQRKNYKKGSPENAMLKLALNGVYGDSNNQFSIFYDPLYTMSITLNGQLLLCLLAENLMRVEGVQMIQINTDGLTVKVPRGLKWMVDAISGWWQQVTGLELEEAIYSRMFVRDVNSYIGEYQSGGVKRKGAYEYELEWHKNASALVVPKVAEQVLLNGGNIRELVMSHPDKMDFMLRVKVPRSSKLVLNDGETDFPLQNLTRYHVSNEGGQLVKLMPPTPKMVKEGKFEWRRIGVQSGWSVCPCNNIADASYDINYDYYIGEVEKLVVGLRCMRDCQPSPESEYEMDEITCQGMREEGLSEREIKELMGNMGRCYVEVGNA